MRLRQGVNFPITLGLSAIILNYYPKMSCQRLYSGFPCSGTNVVNVKFCVYNV